MAYWGILRCVVVMEGGGAGRGGQAVHTHQVACARPQSCQAVGGRGGRQGAGLEAAHHAAVLACFPKRHLPRII